MGYCYCQVALPYSQADRKCLRKESHHHDWLFARARILNKVSQIQTPPYSLYFLQRTGFSPPVLVNTEHNGCGITLKASISLPYVARLSLREKLGQMQQSTCELVTQFKVGLVMEWQLHMGQSSWLSIVSKGYPIQQRSLMVLPWSLMLFLLTVDQSQSFSLTGIPLPKGSEVWELIASHKTISTTCVDLLLPCGYLVHRVTVSPSDFSHIV